MNLQKLNYMITIADEGSLSKAAEKLFITPSALSQYISREEDLLGVPLFSRSREKWILTYAGKVYIDAARRMININDDTERLIQDIADCNVGEFTVGITPGRVTLFGAIYPAFKEKYPNIKIHLKENSWGALQRQLLDNQLDLAFTSLDDITRQPVAGLKADVLAEESFILMVPRSHRLAKHYGDRFDPEHPQLLELAEIADEPFLGYTKDTTLNQVMTKLFRLIDRTPSYLFEGSSIVSVHNLASRGLAPAILPSQYAGACEEAVYFIPEPNVKRYVAAITRDGFTETKAMKYMTELMRQYWIRLADRNPVVAVASNAKDT